jgi:hypothetical protein
VEDFNRNLEKAKRHAVEPMLRYLLNLPIAFLFFVLFVSSYAFGQQPVLKNFSLADSNSPRLPQFSLVGNTVEVTYQRATNCPDIITQFESSPDLSSWTAVSETSLGVNGQVETRRHTTTRPAGAKAFFYRLKVILP